MPRPNRDKYAGPRGFFQAVGPIALLIGVVLVGVAVADFFSAFNSMGGSTPSKFFLAFIGLPLMAVGGWMIQAGYLHAIADYASTETADGVTTTVSAARRGWEEGAEPDDDETDAEPGQRLFCSSCGVKNDLDAKFCDSCGARLSQPV
ncbi:MAG: hypothetical protein ACI89L_000060 [Phycisphaerales bacterium]|jgi:hypothetical protein